MDALKAIARDPDLAVEIDNDKEAKAVLLKLGLIQKFTRDAGLSGPVVQLLAYDDIKTHMLTAVLFQGHEMKKDNGFIVYLMPRGGFPDPRANHQLVENMKKKFEAGGVRVVVHNATSMKNN